MKNFLSSLRKLDSSAHVLRDRKVASRQHQLFTTLLLSSAIIGSSIGLMASSATAAPARKDWCSTIWTVESQNTLGWINPATGVTTTSSPPPNLTMPTGSMGSAVAAIGIHTESGTMFAFDRTGVTGTLYKNTLGVNNSGWVPVPVTGLTGLTGTQTIAGASNNLNKMTVDGNTLFIAESNGVAVYSIPLNSNGTLSGTVATPTIYTFSGDPGVYQHRSTTNTDPAGTEVINGGDLTTDEYGDTYNVTYNVVVTGYNASGQQLTTTTKAYFYKQSGSTWVYQGETAATANFAGAAFYNGSLYVKSALQLKKVPLTRSGSGYTGWSSTLSNIGSPSGLGAGSADLTACGTPNITMTKTQQIYADAALTTLVADQTKVKTGQYIKYTITAQNTGTSWSRNTTVTDSLPTGTTYVPNSASLNGTSSGFTTYPTSGFVINAPGSAAGTVPYSTGVAGSDTATMSFAVQVTALNGAVQNQATIAYVDNSGLPSEPSSCTSPFLNCSITPSATVTSVDFGDAPDGSTGATIGNYRTTESDNGPNHVITAGLKLGATAPDADSGLQQNTAANADGADEDAFTSLPNVPTTGTYSLTNVPVTNTTGSTATLRAWVDFNNNGSFEAGESTSATVANNATTANLSWTVPAGTVAGSTYARFRLTTQALTDNTATTAEDERSFGAASNGEVEDYPVSITAPIDPNTIVPTGSFCQASGGTPALNQMSSEFGGTFGTLASGYRNVQNPPTGYTYKDASSNGASYGLTSGTASIDNGANGIVTLTPSSLLVLYSAATYTVTSQSGSGQNLNPFGPWRTVAGVTTGLANDAFLAVNGDAAVGDFVIQPITVQPNTNYEFGIWAMNPHGTNSPYGGVGEEPNVGVEIVGITSTETGLLTKGANWKRGSVLFNSGNRTSVTLKMRNITTQVVGNDFYVDGMFAAQCSNLPVGNVTGTVYNDTNGNGVQDSGELGIAGTTLTLKDKNGVPVTVTTGSTGNYTFSNIADVAALENYSVTVDSTSTPLAGKTSTTPTSTSNINVVAGTPVSGGNYGFKPPVTSNPNVLLVKRITAVNGLNLNIYKDDTDNTALRASDDNNPNWPTPFNTNATLGDTTISTFLRGAIDGGKVKPGDTIEYTIYFLNAGGSNANNVRVCDRITGEQKFLSGSTIQLQQNSATPTALTSIADADRATFYSSSSNPAITNCNFTGTPTIDNGAIMVDVTGATGSPTWTTLLGSTGPGTANTYGMVRFTTKVNP